VAYEVESYHPIVLSSDPNADVYYEEPSYEAEYLPHHSSTHGGYSSQSQHQQQPPQFYDGGNQYVEYEGESPQFHFQEYEGDTLSYASLSNPPSTSSSSSSSVNYSNAPTSKTFFPPSSHPPPQHYQDFSHNDRRQNHQQENPYQPYGEYQGGKNSYHQYQS